jgi:hypothetical protein
MTPNTHIPLLATAGIIALIAWRIYTRVRRLVGRQRLSRVRPWVSVILFPLLIFFLLLGSVAYPAVALAELAGVAIGIGLGIYGLRSTSFENTQAGLYYTPSAHIGVALSLLIVGRVTYRVVQLYLSTASFAEQPVNFARSPLTLLIIGTVAGYYATYAFGLLRWRRRVNRAAAAQRTLKE